MPHDNSRAVCYTTAAKVLAPSAKLVLLLENLGERQELVYRRLGSWPEFRTAQGAMLLVDFSYRSP